MKNLRPTQGIFDTKLEVRDKELRHKIIKIAEGYPTVQSSLEENIDRCINNVCKGAYVNVV